MAATAASDATDGPVMSVINKRLRALRKKLNRIAQMEESLAQGKTLNKEQEEVFRSKPAILVQIEELEKLKNPIANVVKEEISLAVQQHQVTAPLPPSDEQQKKDEGERGVDGVVEDLLNLLYFGSMFDVKSQSDFTSIVLTRTHERGCCLTYDTVTDDETDLLGENDLDLISMLGGLLISRPVNTSLSHKSALQRCIDHAKLWLSKSDQPIDTNTDVTYAALRERLNKIMASGYFTATPEIKAPVEMAAAAAAGNFAPFQVPVQEVPIQADYQEKDIESADDQGHENGNNQSGLVEEPKKDEEEKETVEEVVSSQQEEVITQEEVEPSQKNDVEFRDQQYVGRRPYQNQRGGRGGGGRRGYYGGRGGRGGNRGGGAYQNGQNQYYDQPGNYYPRNYYNNRGRGRRGGGHSYNGHATTVPGNHAAHVGAAS